jgi:hypothetical protein
MMMKDGPHHTPLLRSKLSSPHHAPFFFNSSFFVQKLFLSQVAQALCSLMSLRRFWNVFMGLLGSMNNFKVLWLFSLYKKTTFDGFFSLNMDHKMALTPTSLEIKTICFCLNSWSPINRVQTLSTHFWKHCITNIFKRGAMWWKMPLGY